MFQDTNEGKTHYENDGCGMKEHNHCDKCSYETDAIDIPLAIMLSKWCVKCYPKQIQAEFTFQGNSLCEKCFRKSALLE